LIMAFGNGIAFPAINNAALHGVGPKDAGLASAVENTFIQLGGSLGLSVLVTRALRHAANRVGHGVSAAVAATDGYRFALRIAVGLRLLTALVVAVALERVTFVPPDELAVVVVEADAG
jgi:hypothetical protein